MKTTSAKLAFCQALMKTKYEGLKDMETIEFGNDAGMAFSTALKAIYDGRRCKLERNNGQWVVTFK